MSFPLGFPSVGIKNSTFRLRRAVSVSISPFSGASQAYDFGGAWWEGQVTFRPMTYAQAGEVKAFLATMRGQYGTFLYGDPDNLAKGNLGAGGTVLVNGADQSGRSLDVDGMTPGTLIFKAGDFFQIGTGVDARLHMVTVDLISNGSGEGNLSFEPPLRISPADNTALVLTSPKCAMRLAEPAQEWQSGPTSITEVTISFMEAL